MKAAGRKPNISASPTQMRFQGFLTNSHFISGVSNLIKTDPQLLFCSERLRQFSSEQQIEFLECPIGDNRVKRQIQMCIRTITEQLRADKRNFPERDNTSWSERLFPLSTAEAHLAKLPAEIQMSGKNIKIGEPRKKFNWFNFRRIP